MGLAALVSAGLLATGLAGLSPRWDLSLRTEGHYRQLEGTTTEVHRLGELELRPAGQLELVGPAWDLAVAYRPRLTLTDQPIDRTWQHEAELILKVPFATWLATSTVSGSYGRLNLVQLFQSGSQAGGQPGQSQALPWVRSILAEALQAQLLVSGRPATRYKLEAMLAAYLDGGAGPDARTVLPLQRGLRARTSLEWQANHLGTLTSTLSGTVAYFSSGPDVAFAVWEEGWRQRVARDLELWLAAGASATQQRRNGDVSVTTRPSAEAGAVYQFGIVDHQVVARLAGSLAPAVDRVTGEASERLGATASYRLDLARAWVVSAEASGGVVASGAQKGDQAWGGAFSLGRLLGDHLLLDVGARGYDQRQRRDGTRFSEWVLFLGLTAGAKGKLPTVGQP